MDGSNTTVYINDVGRTDSLTDANGNTVPFVGPPSPPSTTTTDFSGCVTSHPIVQATILNFPGPDGRSSAVKVCLANFIPTATFSQPNVQAPDSNLPTPSYPAGGYNYIVSAVMPDGNYWSFDYDVFSNLTSIQLPSGGTITYQWGEIPITNCTDDVTKVSRAVLTRTVNDLAISQTWHYTWGLQQTDGSITNYVLDPAGNETAHVFIAPVPQAGCNLFEKQTRFYQGTHDSGTLLKTVDTHYVGTFD